MRLLLLLSVLVGFAGQAEAAPLAPAPLVDPQAAAPYFAMGPAAEAKQRFQVEDWEGATRLFDEYVRRNARGAERAQAQYMAAMALAKAGRFVEAAGRFEALLPGYPLLADHEHLQAARAWLSARQYEQAHTQARSVARDSPLFADALLVEADASRGEGGVRLVAAEESYRSYLQRYPDSWRTAEAKLHLAQVLEAEHECPVAASSSAAAPPHVGEPTCGSVASSAAPVPTHPGERAPGSVAEVRQLYREVYTRFPTSSGAEEARVRLVALGGDLVLSGAEHLARGLALFEQMRNEASEAELAAALRDEGLPPAQRCEAAYHRAQSVFKQRNRPRAAPLFRQALAECERAKPVAPAVAAELLPKTLYQGARCFAARKEPATAIRLFDTIERAWAGNRYADDARVREAEILDDVLDRLPRRAPALFPAAIAAPPPAARPVLDIAAYLESTPEEHLDPALLRATLDALLAGVPDRYPGGDMAGEALFRLAFRAFEEQRLDDARRHLERELLLLPREEGWWEAGRTLYWLARVAAVQKQPAAAASLFARAAREYPLSYYALQALNRLRESAPDEERKLVEELSRPLPTAEELAWHFPPRPVFASAAFQRAVELARLGLGSDARRELAAAGIRSEKKGARVDDPSRAEELWLAAVLYDRAGEWALSHAIPRYVLPDYARRWPAGDNLKRWLLSYPRGYQALVVDHAGRNGQPAALEFAIIREESAFDPLDESFANAVGLTQLTQAPARRFARGLPFTREALRDPAINVTIGARELGDLWAKSSGSAPLAIASYNAGDGAVRRWLKASPPGVEMDEFIERIPYDETRGYTKRVLASWFAYHFLHEQGDRVPRLPPVLGRLR